jgi:hypothetical protein
MLLSHCGGETARETNRNVIGAQPNKSLDASGVYEAGVEVKRNFE